MSESILAESSVRNPHMRRFADLLAPLTDGQLADLARRSQQATRKHFGRAVRLFAPLYLSNECINSCAYCGFSRENAIVRVTLEVESVLEEARHLAAAGIRNILLVAGEHPKLVSTGYMERCIRALSAEIPSVAVEVAPMETAEYASLVQAGAEGVVIYQETYDRAVYSALHTAGPKKDYDWRLAAPERAYEAGFRRIGIGALFGLKTDWRSEACDLAMHLDRLLKRCWRAQFTVSVPRIRPCAGGFQPVSELANGDFLQLVCALRLTFPQVSIVLSTREEAAFRDAIIPFGITAMSAGSHTEPGGYTGAGRDSLHLTVAGRAVEASREQIGSGATAQFEIADRRSPSEIAQMLAVHRLEAVWKDWDTAILAAS